MLDHLGHQAAAAEVLSAITALLSDTRIRTADLGGSATTTEVTEALLDIASQSSGR
jgi:tartrate dehydrogenase/decarboxylase/D-malate dehydrogenase